MMKTAFLLSAVLLAMSWPAFGETITVTIPDLDIPYTATSASFTVPVQIEGTYNLDNYSLYLQLSPQGGASGVTFNTGADAADEASSDYIFDSNVGWLTSLSNTTNIAGDDSVTGAPGDNPQTRTDGTWNTITVKLDAALTAGDIGDMYDVTFFQTGAFSKFQIWDGALADVPSGQMTWDPGVITVTIPEPGSIVMLFGLGLSSLIFYRRRWKG